MNNERSKLKGFFWLVLGASLAICLSLGFSVIVHMVPFSVEQRLAQALPPIENWTVCHDGEGSLALTTLANRLYPLSSISPISPISSIEPSSEKTVEKKKGTAIPIEVRAVRDSEVNAFASLAGQIFITSALIEQAQGPDEVAGILAHEIEHVIQRHVLEAVLVKIGTFGAIKLLFNDTIPGAVEISKMIAGIHYNRAQEHEADLGGLKRLVAAEVDTSGLQKFFARMQNSSIKVDFISDHPTDESRSSLVKTFEQFQKDTRKATRPILTATQWHALQRICH